jgi:hypothetical protein
MAPPRLILLAAVGLLVAHGTVAWGAAGRVATLSDLRIDEVVEQVMAAVAPLRVRRLVAAWLPVAASLLLALVGVAMVGGVPGGSLLAQLPVVSSQAWLALANAASDWGVAMSAAAGAARLAMPPAILIAAVVAAVVGLVLIVAATRRWQPVARWHRGD